MKYRLPILLAVAALAAGSWMIARSKLRPSTELGIRSDRGEVSVEPPSVSLATVPLATVPLATISHRANTALHPGNTPKTTIDGRELLVRSIQQLRQQPAIEARVRQRLLLYGNQFIGSGYYRQLGQGPNKFLLWELKMEINGEITSLKQVSDRRYLWIHRNFPDRTEQGLVDLRKVRQARAAAAPRPGPGSPWMAVGGLSELLQGLERYFEFSAAHSEKLGDHPVWVLEGYWKPKHLAALLPDQKGVPEQRGKPISPGNAGPRSVPSPRRRPPRLSPATLAKLPPHLPHRVVLVLGRDPVVPLFPYRIEFQRIAPGKESGAGQGPGAGNGAGQGAGGGGGAVSESIEYAPLLLMEFFEIRRASLVPEQFVFDPGDKPVVDETERYLKMLGLTSSDQSSD